MGAILCWKELPSGTTKLFTTPYNRVSVLEHFEIVNPTTGAITLELKDEFKTEDGEPTTVSRKIIYIPTERHTTLIDKTETAKFLGDVIADASSAGLHLTLGVELK